MYISATNTTAVDFTDIETFLLSYTGSHSRRQTSLSFSVTLRPSPLPIRAGSTYGEWRGVQRILVGKPDGKRTHGKTRE
jgi:hypothetical protein